MALILPDRYPGRANPPTAEYPQGSFKNRTAPGAKDGSYLEEDWANDIQGLLQSILNAASISANGRVDKVGDSQYYQALESIFHRQATELAIGSVKIATQSDVEGRADDEKTPTIKKLAFGFAFLFAQNGFIKFPNWLGGLIIQWGLGASAGTGTVVFPFTFPNSAYTIVATDNGSECHSFGITALRNNSFDIVSRRISTGALVNAGYRWIAIGR